MPDKLADASPIQLLILDKLDNQNDAIKELKRDIKDTRDDVTELRVNHMAHLVTDIAILKDHSEQAAEWRHIHDKRHIIQDREKERGRWKMWVAVIGGFFAALVAAITAYIK